MDNLFAQPLPAGYESPAEHLLDWLELVAMLAQREKPGADGDNLSAEDAYITIKQNAAQAGPALPLTGLTRRLGLFDFSVFCAIMASAGGFDPAFDALYLGFGKTRWPTLGLAVRLFSHIGPVSGEDLAQVLDPEGPCRLLFSLQGEQPHMGRLMRPAPHLHAVLRGDIAPFAALPGMQWWLPRGAPPADVPQAGPIGSFVQAIEADGRAALVLLTGQPGCGRTGALRAVAGRLGFGLAILDAPALARLPEEALGAACRDVLLWAAALDARVVLRGLSPGLAEAPVLRRFIEDSARALCTVFLTSTAGIPGWLPMGDRLVEFTFEPDNLLARRRLWQQAAEDCALDEAVDLGEYANKLHYTAGSIRNILRRAAMHAQSRGAHRITGQDIDRAVRLHNAAETESRGLTHVECVFTWEDIVLPCEPLELLHSACDRILYAHTVNDTWGFGPKLPYGRGVSILLYGPPGTGKTMSAQVIARQLGLQLYKVDLSQLVSKYIGETEKNMADIFSFARRTGCVLLFDEADSLFSRRTEVKDAGDRHANTETAFLLQKIEEHSGVSILSTNLLSNMDNAFRRRFTYVVGIPAPDAALRLQIWNKVFPPQAPLAPGLDFRGFANHLELTASAIKAIALNAAYMAAARGSGIDHALIVKAVRAELLKQGTRMSEPEITQLCSG